MSENQDGGGTEQPTPEHERPAPASTPPPAANEGEKAVNLSIEERGVVVMPAVPVPTNEVDIGGMPSADASPVSGGGGGGTDAAPADAGGGAAPSGDSSSGE